jgi:hypothetical protein
MNLERNAGTDNLLLVIVGPVTESSEFQLYCGTLCNVISPSYRKLLIVKTRGLPA